MRAVQRDYALHGAAMYIQKWERHAPVRTEGRTGQTSAFEFKARARAKQRKQRTWSCICVLPNVQKRFDLILHPLATGFSAHCKRTQPLNVSKSVEPDVADYLPNGLELFYAIKHLSKQPVNRSKKYIKDN
jgi:hypothetical protein